MLRQDVFKTNLGHNGTLSQFFLDDIISSLVELLHSTREYWGLILSISFKIGAVRVFFHGWENPILSNLSLLDI